MVSKIEQKPKTTCTCLGRGCDIAVASNSIRTESYTISAIQYAKKRKNLPRRMAQLKTYKCFHNHLLFLEFETIESFTLFTQKWTALTTILIGWEQHCPHNLMSFHQGTAKTCASLTKLASTLCTATLTDTVSSNHPRPVLAQTMA